MRTTIRALLLAAMLAALALPAQAHGGKYRGPGGEVPPGSRDPKDPQPPPENPTEPTGAGGGPVTGDPGGPVTGDPSPDPSRPRRPVPGDLPRQGPNTGAFTPGGRSGPPPLSYDNWLFWWGYNNDEFLALKASLRRRDRRAASPTAAGIYMGRGGHRNVSGIESPTAEKVRREVVPALLAVIGNEDIHADIRGGALIALARCESGRDHVKLFCDLARPSAGEHQLVQESAVLALGILGERTPAVRDFLVDLLEDDRAPFRTRSFAALALGLLAEDHPRALAALTRRLDGRESTPDVPVCALVALGLIGHESSVESLTDCLENGRIGPNRLSDQERAYVVAALGKAGRPSALPAVDAALRNKGVLTRRSAAIAVGQIVPHLIDEAARSRSIRRLASLIDSESDPSTVNFALISLGRIAGHAAADEDVRKACVAILTERFTNGGKATERPFAALALGVALFEPDGGAPRSPEMRYAVARMVREELADLRGDKTALGALAICLGLIGDRDKATVNLLEEILADRRTERKLRGSAAVALGLIGDPGSKKPILAALSEREDRQLRLDTAIAAGLLADSDASAALVNILNDRMTSQFVLGSVALALGQIGDAAAVAPLIAILEPERTDGTYPALTRALVAVALGQLANQRDLPVLFRLSKDINYRASVGALDEALTIL